MTADVAGAHDEGLGTSMHFHLALHDVGNEFMGVGVQRRADAATWISRKVISSPLISGLTSISPPYIGWPSTALTAALTSAFLDMIT